MMFTPQQLRGAARYNAKTRVGNWNEDQRLQETRVADYKAKKERGQLATHKMDTKLKLHNQKVPLSYAKDSKVRYSDNVRILSAETNAAVAVDIYEETYSGSREFIVTGSQEAKVPTARTTFRIVPYDKSNGDELKYGDSFYICCNDSLRVNDNNSFLAPPQYLKSALKSDKRISAVSDHQQVFLSLGGGNDALWRILKTAEGPQGGAERVLSEGQSVSGNDDVIIQHKMTGQALCCSKEHRQSTDFGSEFEVCCNSARSAGRNHHLKKEFNGTTTADTGVRAELNSNHFKLQLASDPSQSVDKRGLPSEATVEGMCKHICGRIMGSSIYGLRTFVLMNKDYVEKGKGSVDREDMKFGLIDLGVDLSENQLDILLDSFDKRKDGMLSFDAIRVALRGGSLEESRREAVNEVFDVLSSKCEGEVTMAKVLSNYKASSFASAKGVSEDVAREEFAKAWGTLKPTDVVSRQEFADFYRDVSPSFERDADFCKMIRGCW